MKSIDSGNDKVVSMIEAAAFIVCLDNGMPSTPSERCNQFFLGTPSNRWSDKTMQLVICEHGVSAFVCEHAMIDGIGIRPFNQFITEALLQHKSGQGRSQDCLLGEYDATNGPVITDLCPGLDHLVKEYTFIINEVIERHIDRIQQKFSNTYQRIEFTYFRANNIGKNFLRAHKCPSKHGYRLVIQLACFLFYGYQPPSWETLSMARFHKVRVDWIQTIQPNMAKFCASARDSSIPLVMRRKLLFDAVKMQANSLTQVSRAHGFLAHMYTLLGVLRDDEPLPALFLDQAWEATRISSVKNVKIDCLEGLIMQETAFLLPEEECIYVHYEVQEDR